MIRERLLTGTFSNGLAKVVAVGTWFVLTPFLLRQLGAGEYALWALMGAVASYGFLLDFGIGGAVVKYVAEHTARRDHGAAAALVASAAWVYLALAVLTVTVGALLAPFVPSLLGVGAGRHDAAAWLVFLTVSNVGITIAFTPWASTLKGLQRYDLYNAVGIGNSLAEALAIVAAVSVGWGVMGMVAVLIAVNAATGVACVAVVRRIAPELRLGGRGAAFGAIRQIASFSTPTFVIDVAGRLQTKTDEFVIAAFGALALVTPYALARRLGELAQAVCVQFLKVVMPLASALEATDDLPRLRVLYLTASRIALGTAVPITVCLLMLGDNILTAWVGREYAPYADVLAVLALATLISTSQWPAVEVLQGMARHRVVAVASLGAGIVNVALSIALLPGWGLFGVAVGTLIPALGASLGVVLPVAHRTLGVPYARSLREVWAPGLVPAAGAALVLWTFTRAAVEPNGLETLTGMAVAGAVYATGYLAMPAAGPERKLATDLLTGGSRRLRQLRLGVSRP